MVRARSVWGKGDYRIAKSPHPQNLWAEYARTAASPNRLALGSSSVVVAGILGYFWETEEFFWAIVIPQPLLKAVINLKSVGITLSIWTGMAMFALLPISERVGRP